MSRCESCGADDELLFTCGHCGDQFCVGHQFPHHACRRFRSDGDADGAVGGFEWVRATPGGSASAESREDGGASVENRKTGDAAAETPKVSAAESDAEADDRDSGTAEGNRADGATEAAGTDGGVARDAAKAMRPDREGTPGPPPGRGMPWERGGEGVADWMRAQSYPAYLLKVGGLSLLLMTAYYVGLAAMLYG